MEVVQLYHVLWHLAKGTSRHRVSASLSSPSHSSWKCEGVSRGLVLPVESWTLCAFLTLAGPPVLMTWSSTYSPSFWKDCGGWGGRINSRLHMCCLVPGCLRFAGFRITSLHIRLWLLHRLWIIVGKYAAQGPANFSDFPVSSVDLLLKENFWGSVGFIVPAGKTTGGPLQP